MQFQIEHQQGKARAGTLHFPGGISVQTPAFLPIIHCHQLDHLMLQELHAMGFNLITVQLINLLQRPGWEWLSSQGRIHDFLAWPGAILTDVAFEAKNSLFQLVNASHNAVTLRSVVDGGKISLPAEKVMVIQSQLGADLITSLTGVDEDDFTKVQPNVTRCLFENNRVEVLDQLNAGNEKLCYWRDDQTQNLSQLKVALNMGIDLISSAAPALAAQQGQIFTTQGMLEIDQPHFALDFTKIDETCLCYTCQHFTRAYFHHLRMCGEMLAIRLIALHNFYFYQQSFKTWRKEIEGVSS